MKLLNVELKNRRDLDATTTTSVSSDEEFASSSESPNVAEECCEIEMDV